MKKYKTEWNLGLLYKGNEDSAIEKDLVAIENACRTFALKYKNKDFTNSPKNLLGALEDYESLNKKVGGYKPWWYFALKNDLNSGDTKVGALATKYETRLAEAGNNIKFFGLKIAKITSKDQKKFIQDKILAPYAYMLQRIFNRAKFNLSESEEQLSNLLSQTSYTMWIDSGERLLGQQTIPHKGKEIPVSKAMLEVADLPKKERRELYKKVNEKLKSISYFAEAEINAVFNFKKTMDKRRTYKKPYSATVLAYENKEKSVESLVSLVSKNFKISHRFYKLHARLLGEKKITMADRNVSMGIIRKKFDFDSSVSIVRERFAKIDQEYVTILDKFLANGQIDVYPKKGKKGGAYCWGMGGLPTFVLLNHNDNVKSVETLAHEMGHAIHTELSNKQPPRYQKYSMATAEVASTFFEQMVSEEIDKYLSDKEKIIMLHTRLMGDISTIFRQIACFNFELELHQKIREAGQVSKEEIADLLAKHMKTYLGDAVEVNREDGYFFISWSHIRRYFYVYSYAYGQIVSRALFTKWKEDPAYGTKIKEFLSMGRSMSPEDIFKKIGIDTSDPSFFEAGLKSIEEDIKKLEKLTGNKN